MSQPINALVLFSGGLDSMLAARTLMEQEIAVTALCFKSGFFDAAKAQIGAKQLDVPLRIVDITNEQLALVKNPPNGYGKHLNPCIDCHGRMIAAAAAIARAEGFAIVATGEVLGQRPFSQNKQALSRVEAIAGIEVLRPLSAKLLPETVYEKDGLVARHRLHDISGRRREAQTALAARYGLRDLPTPAGGCLLTDPVFSERLGKLLGHWPQCQADDVALLKLGRTAWYTLPDAAYLLVVGRDQAESETLAAVAKRGDFVVQLKDLNGPVALLRGVPETAVIPGSYTLDIPERASDPLLHEFSPAGPEPAVAAAARLTAYYAPKARGRTVTVLCERKKF